MTLQMTKFLTAMEEMMETQIDSLLAEMKDDQEEMAARLEAKMNANLREITEDMRDRREETKADREAMEACLEKTDWQVPKQHATVKSSEALTKQHRGRNLAAQRLKELKERTRGNCESQKKLAAASRKMTSRTAMA
jgi:hypothetical protein